MHIYLHFYKCFSNATNLGAYSQAALLKICSKQSLTIPTKQIKDGVHVSSEVPMYANLSRSRYVISVPWGKTHNYGIFSRLK